MKQVPEAESFIPIGEDLEPEAKVRPHVMLHCRPSCQALHVIGGCLLHSM